MHEAVKPADRERAARSPAASAETEALSFEDSLERLEGIVERLEQGDLALEEALARFEEGVGLSRRLGERLASAERRVDELLRDGTGLATRPLGEDSA